MEILTLYYCLTANALLSDCKPYKISDPIPHERCVEERKIRQAVLGTASQQNYRLLCEPAD